MSTELEDSATQYEHSLGRSDLLEKLACSLLVTNNQGSKLAVFRAHEGKLSVLPHTFEKAMGAAVSSERIAVGTKYQIWIMENELSRVSTTPPEGQHDAYCLPRRSLVTGDLCQIARTWRRLCRC